MHEEFKIKWTPEEQAKIEECRQWAAARRMMRNIWKPEWDNHHSPSKAEMTRRIYREITSTRD